jgi:beta-phosphoglucomutase
MNQAYDYYLWSSRLDLDNYNRNSHQGLHISSMSGSWMNIVFGFGGLQFSKDKLVLNPSLPQGWNKLSFKIVYRGNQLQFIINKEQIECRLLNSENNKPVELLVADKSVVLSNANKVHTEALIQKLPIEPKAVIFDLDGVICDTAEYHYLAWKSIADEEGIYFDVHINERLKGVSRMKSLEILMEKATRSYTDDELADLAEKKNNIYKDFLKDLTPSDILEGIEGFVQKLKEKGFKLGICSASKNAPGILDYLKATDWFDAIVSGNDPVEPKPHPAGFILAAEKLGVDPKYCVVVEDAFAGIESAKQAGMKTLGIGYKLILHNADYTLPSTKYLNLERIHLLY